MSDAWNAFILGCRDRYGVTTVEHARAVGVAPASYYRRTIREGWTAPYHGVRVAPWVKTSELTDLAALLAAAGPDAAATGRTAAWLHGLCDTPRALEAVIPHHQRVPAATRGQVRRSRWVTTTDLAVARKLPTLNPAATIVSLAGEAPLDLRALIIDALHRELVEIAEIAARLAATGPVRGRRSLALILHALADRDVESIFHDLVLDELTRRGYGPTRSPLRVATPDGRGVHPDIPLPQWLIAIEVQGDRFHRTRAQRAADRRKASQYAGSGWIHLELDWWEWMGDRDHFLAALDAAILNQVRRGSGDPTSVPPHLRTEANRVHAPSPGTSEPVSGTQPSR